MPTVIAQGTTTMGIELVAVVGVVLSVIFAIRFLLVFQLSSLTESLLTYVAMIVICVPDIETVADVPVEQSQE
jgi:hypothetical protein